MKLLQRWQLSYQEEQSLAAECATALQYGFTGILAKAMDGRTFMAAFDSNPDAIGNPDDVARQAAYCHTQGLTYDVWFNPLQQYIEEQAYFAALCIEACDGGWFDTEPYKGFWGAWAPVGLAQDYAGRVRQAVSQGKRLVWQPDPRPQHLAELRPEEWAPYMNGYAPQDYVTDFYFTPDASLYWALLNDTLANATAWGLVPLTTVPGNAPVDFIDASALGRFGGFATWRIGTTPTAMLQHLGGITLATEVTDCAAAEAARDKFDLFFRDLADRVVVGKLVAEMARRTKAGKPAAIRRSVLEQIVEETQLQRAEAYGNPEAVARSHMLAVNQGHTPLLRQGAHGNIAEGAR